MKIKNLKKNFFFQIPKSSGRIDWSNPHVKSEPNRRNSLNGNRLDGRTDAGASPHRTMISASSILAELKMVLEKGMALPTYGWHCQGTCPIAIAKHMFT